MMMKNKKTAGSGSTTSSGRDSWMRRASSSSRGSKNCCCVLAWSALCMLTMTLIVERDSIMEVASGGEWQQWSSSSSSTWRWHHASSCHQHNHVWLIYSVKLIQTPCFQNNNQWKERENKSLSQLTWQFVFIITVKFIVFLYCFFLGLQQCTFPTKYIIFFLHLSIFLYFYLSIYLSRLFAT